MFLLFNDFEYKFQKNKNIVMLVSFILLILIVGALLIFVLNKPEESEPIIENPDNSVTEVVIDEEKEKEDSVTQEVAISQKKGLVLSKNDLSTRIEYKVLIGTGSNEKEIKVVANTNTLYYDMEGKKLLSVQDIDVGDKIIFYGVGKYNIEDITATVICLGDDASYSMAVISKIEDKDSGILYEIEGSYDKIYIDKSSPILNARDSSNLSNYRLMDVGSIILYKYNPEFKIEDKGNIYTSTETILLGNTSDYN